MTELEQFKENEWQNITSTPDLQMDENGNIVCVYDGSALHFNFLEDFDDSQKITLSKDQILGFVAGELVFNGKGELVEKSDKE